MAAVERLDLTSISTREEAEEYRIEHHIVPTARGMKICSSKYEAALYEHVRRQDQRTLLVRSALAEHITGHSSSELAEANRLLRGIRLPHNPTILLPRLEAMLTQYAVGARQKMMSAICSAAVKKLLSTDSDIKSRPRVRTMLKKCREQRVDVDHRPVDWSLASKFCSMAPAKRAERFDTLDTDFAATVVVESLNNFGAKMSGSELVHGQVRLHISDALIDRLQTLSMYVCDDATRGLIMNSYVERKRLAPKSSQLGSSHGEITEGDDVGYELGPTAARGNKFRLNLYNADMWTRHYYGLEVVPAMYPDGHPISFVDDDELYLAAIEAEYLGCDLEGIDLSVIEYWKSESAACRLRDILYLMPRDFYVRPPPSSPPSRPPVTVQEVWSRAAALFTSPRSSQLASSHGEITEGDDVMSRFDAEVFLGLYGIQHSDFDSPISPERYLEIVSILCDEDKRKFNYALGITNMSIGMSEDSRAPEASDPLIDDGDHAPCAADTNRLSDATESAMGEFERALWTSCFEVQHTEERSWLETAIDAAIAVDRCLFIDERTRILDVNCRRAEEGLRADLECSLISGLWALHHEALWARTLIHHVRVLRSERAVIANGHAMLALNGVHCSVLDQNPMPSHVYTTDMAGNLIPWNHVAYGHRIGIRAPAFKTISLLRRALQPLVGFERVKAALAVVGVGCLAASQIHLAIPAAVLLGIKVTSATAMVGGAVLSAADNSANIIDRYTSSLSFPLVAATRYHTEGYVVYLCYERPAYTELDGDFRGYIRNDIVCREKTPDYRMVYLVKRTIVPSSICYDVTDEMVFSGLVNVTQVKQVVPACGTLSLKELGAATLIANTRASADKLCNAARDFGEVVRNNTLTYASILMKSAACQNHAALNYQPTTTVA